MAVKQPLNQKGFSLIEVLVATVILSIMMVGVIQITNNSIDSTENIVTEDNRRYQLQSAMMRLDRDIRLLYSPLYFAKRWQKKKDQNQNQNNQTNSYNNQEAYNPNSRFERHPRFVFVSDNEHPVPKFIFEEKSKITFLTTSNLLYNPNQKQSRFSWVEYYLTEMDDLTDEDKSKELGQLRLVRKSNSEDIYSLRDDIFSEQKAFEILDHIVELNFKVWDTKTEKFVDSIREIQNKNERLAIKAVQVNLTWKPFANEEIKISKIFTPLWPFYDAKEHDKVEATPTPITRGVN